MASPSQILITKANGDIVPFSVDKLRRSLRNAGASEEAAGDVADEILRSLESGATTKKIYRQAFDLLKQTNRPVAARYRLKEAIMALGPSGFPFEKYFGEILKHQGYSVQVGQIVQGRCVTHEIDVIAEKDNDQIMVECKYHNQPGKVTDVKVPLYIRSRFLDVKDVWEEQPQNRSKVHQGWVATNTRFTGDALRYGLCKGMHMVSWDFPQKSSLKDQIDTLGLYPITCLTTLTSQEKRLLLEKNIVLCKELCRQPDWLAQIGVTSLRIEKTMEEGRFLCQTLVRHGQH